MDLRAAVEQLTQQTNFRIAPELLHSFLERMTPSPVLSAPEHGAPPSPQEDPAPEPEMRRDPGWDLDLRRRSGCRTGTVFEDPAAR